MLQTGACPEGAPVATAACTGAMTGFGTAAGFGAELEYAKT